MASQKESTAMSPVSPFHFSEDDGRERLRHELDNRSPEDEKLSQLESVSKNPFLSENVPRWSSRHHSDNEPPTARAAEFTVAHSNSDVPDRKLFNQNIRLASTPAASRLPRANPFTGPSPNVDTENTLRLSVTNPFRGHISYTHHSAVSSPGDSKTALCNVRDLPVATLSLANANWLAEKVSTEPSVCRPQSFPVNEPASIGTKPPSKSTSIMASSQMCSNAATLPFYPGSQGERPPLLDMQPSPLHSAAFPVTGLHCVAATQPQLSTNMHTHLPDPHSSLCPCPVSSVSGHHWGVPVSVTQTPSTPAACMHKRSVPLGRYDGTSSYEAFRKKFELMAKCNGWTEGEKMGHLAASLEGDALQIFLDVEGIQVTHTDQLHLALSRRFGDTTSTLSRRQQFQDRVRGVKEPLGVFMADLRYLAQCSYPSFSVEVRNALALDSFIRGLTPDTLRQQLRLMHPSTPEEALQHALSIEGIFNEKPSTPHKSSWNSHPRSFAVYPREGAPPPPAAEPTAMERETVTCWRCGEIGHLRRHCTKQQGNDNRPE